MSGHRLFEAAIGIVIVVLVAGLTHLLAVLILPDVATKDAFTMLRESIKAPSVGNGMTLLPASKPGDSLIPFRDPATVQGVCFFDLSKEPYRIKVKTDESRLLTLSFRTPKGLIFYSMTDRAASHDLIDIHLLTSQQLKAVEDSDDDDQGLPSELRLKAPALRGMVVATSLVARPGEGQDADKRIKAIVCQPEPLPPPPS